MARFSPGYIIRTPLSLAENLKNVHAEIFEDRMFCAPRGELETQIPLFLIGCTSNVSYSTLNTYVPVSVSYSECKLSPVVLCSLLLQCCVSYFIPPFFLTAPILSLAGNPMNGSITGNSMVKSSLPPWGTGSMLRVLAV